MKNSRKLNKLRAQIWNVREGFVDKIKEISQKVGKNTNTKI